jgi:DNA repair protein RecN (Recombination protein N)
MLTGLSIRDVVIIEALDLDFAAGLGALTGETGAGKSILLDSLGLALGARADSGLVRHGAERAMVTATFEVAVGSAVTVLLAENDIAVDPGEPVIVKRTVRADGGSRATINDQPASVSLLREIGTLLVEIHGQHDDRGLLNPRGHRALLDAFARADTGAVGRAFAALRATEDALASARDELDAAERDREWLEHAVAELTGFGPEAGEEESLAEARATMQRGAKAGQELADIAALLDGSDGALTQLRQATRRLDRLAGEHEALAAALTALDRALIEASEGEDHLARAAEALAYDPDRLDSIETRLFELRALARKHRVAPDDLAALAEELGARLMRIQAGGEGIAALEKAQAEARATYLSAADTLTATRTAAAARLDAAVVGELVPLKLDAARFRTVIEPLGEGQWSPMGRDRIEFEVSTNPGAPFGALIKIASGGELSRFILALKVALAEEGGAATMVFDEIDRGVGGAVASAIGERLARLATKAQLLVVTHSPQVAARADRQWLIAKSHDGTVTRTDVRPLGNDERREEIARMLSGAEVTDEARAQARRLLEAA